MEPIKAIKKQRILKRDILIFKQYIYRDKTNANKYHLFDVNGCFILRYCKNKLQFISVPLKHIPSKSAYYSSGEIKKYLKEFTDINNEYNERKNTLNPRYDETYRIQVHTEHVSRKRFKELERYFNKKG